MVGREEPDGRGRLYRELARGQEEDYGADRQCVCGLDPLRPAVGQASEQAVDRGRLGRAARGSGGLDTVFVGVVSCLDSLQFVSSRINQR